VLRTTSAHRGPAFQTERICQPFANCPHAQSSIPFSRCGYNWWRSRRPGSSACHLQSSTAVEGGWLGTYIEKWFLYTCACLTSVLAGSRQSGRSTIGDQALSKPLQAKHIHHWTFTHNLQRGPLAPPPSGCLCLFSHCSLTTGEPASSAASYIFCKAAHFTTQAECSSCKNETSFCLLTRNCSCKVSLRCNSLTRRCYALTLSPLCPAHSLPTAGPHCSGGSF
jgi:hypothetical protein